MRPVERAIGIALPRLQTLEGHSFEKLVKQLHIECSRKGVGDFGLSEINMGYWNRPRDASRAIELDLVAVDSDDRRVRFGSCKRSPASHDARSLAEFEKNIAAFTATREGRRLTGWSVERVCFSPVFSAAQRAQLERRGYTCRDLAYYASLF